MNKRKMSNTKQIYELIDNEVEKALTAALAELAIKHPDKDFESFQREIEDNEYGEPHGQFTITIKDKPKKRRVKNE